MKSLENKDFPNERASWIIGGGVILGVGVGFFLFHISVFFFVGSILAGLGLGLIVAPFIKGR